MTEQPETTETLVIHSDWSTEKALAHLEDLRANRDREEAIRDAFLEAADQRDRAVIRIEQQIAHSTVLFSNPRRPGAQR